LEWHLRPRARFGIAILAALGLAVIATLLLLRPDDAAQVDALFSRIEGALEEGRAGELLAQLDREYDSTAHWPELGRYVTGDGSGDVESALRDRVRRQLAGAFFAQDRAGGERQFDYHVDEQSVARDADGLVHADVAIGYTSSDNLLKFSIDPPREHRFVMATDGWLLPELRIRSHDRIPLR